MLYGFNRLTLFLCCVSMAFAFAEKDGAKIAQYYARHGVQASAITRLQSLEYSDSSVRKFALRGMKNSSRQSLPGEPDWWEQLPAAKPNMSFEQEMEIGLCVAGRLMQDFKVVDNADVHEYINLLGRHVTGKSMRHDIVYRFVVLHAKHPMAYAAPAGFIFVTDGLIRLLETEDELAFVLAHEGVHVARFHGIKSVENSAAVRHSRDAFTDLAVEKATRGDARVKLEAATSQAYKKFMNISRSIEKERAAGNFEAAFEDLDRTQKQGLHLDREDEELDLDAFADYAYRVVSGFRNRTEEFESDTLGTDILVRCGYDKEAAASLLAKLRSALGETPFVLDDSTHPRFSDRIKTVNKHMESRWSRAHRRMIHTGSRFRDFRNSLQ